MTFKVLTEHSPIVAVRPTGNVYAKEAVDTLNVKAKNWKDLLTDEPFTRADLITIQDPSDLSKFNIQTFFHLQHAASVGWGMAGALFPSFSFFFFVTL